MSAAQQQTSHAAMMPPPQMPPKQSAPMKNRGGGGDDLSLDSSDDHHGGDRKLQKRAANRKSAQLSRKRKKQFMEELREENDCLRRKEQILMSIPDLIVVFDSTGKLWFVSQSVESFLKYSAYELEGTSIWERLCDDSVRLLKAAFMDSLAARRPEADTAILGSGFWELKLVDRDGSFKNVTLNGVVHFTGDRPECVCSIRPSEGATTVAGLPDQDAECTSAGHRSLIRVKPHQSVVSGSDNSSSSDNNNINMKHNNRPRPGRAAVRISDSGNSSGSNNSMENSSGGESETGSANGSSDE
jgi:PAS domain S-box-containing protein